jgi:hypothetical protein
MLREEDCRERLPEESEKGGKRKRKEKKERKKEIDYLFLEKQNELFVY